jgi:uncharacterized protein (TIGR03118 family)
MGLSIRRATPAIMAAAAGLALCAAPAGASQYTVTNLVSDGSVPAVTVDPDLINPWGLSYSPTGPFWVSDNNWGTSTVYNGAGAKQALTVNIPTASGAGLGSPTGQVFNATSGFTVTSGGKSGAAAFLFATEDGTISGWAPSVDSANAIIAVNNSASIAVYKGLAIATKGKKTYLYAANFWSGDVEMYDSSFKMLKTFTDPTIPAGYAPYNVQAFGPLLYVTYAKQDAARHDSVSGAGFGYVDTFTLKGAFQARIVSQGNLNAPWGLDIAPAGFGDLAGDLLVGNFGDGNINAYNPSTGAFVGQVDGSNGKPIVFTDLWGLINGNGGSGGDANTVYFTAGLKGEQHGLFGSLSLIAGATKR